MKRGTKFSELHGGKVISMNTSGQTTGKNPTKGTSHLRKRMSRWENALRAGLVRKKSTNIT